jgi:hypothetical protein
MTGTSSSFSASSPQHAGSMDIMTNYACTHTEFDTVAFSPDLVSVNFRSIDGLCPREECQSKFASKMKSELQLAGINCESALRRFGNIEPMLGEELTMAGCAPDVVKALLNCAHRSASTTAYLSHYSALGLLAKFESCANQENANQEQVNSLAAQLSAANRTVQHKLVALQGAVCRLTMNGFPAPGHAFPMIQGISTHEVNWGKAELAALKSCDEGQAILPLPLNSENILAAKSCILRANAELASFQDSEAAAFHADYPGTKHLVASGEMQSSQAMLAAWENQGSTMESSFSSMSIDSEDVETVMIDAETFSADIRLLRPERVASRKMASNSLTVDMGAVNRYSGKPYTQLSNPWWANK